MLSHTNPCVTGLCLFDFPVAQVRKWLFLFLLMKAFKANLLYTCCLFSSIQLGYAQSTGPQNYSDFKYVDNSTFAVSSQSLTNASLEQFGDIQQHFICTGVTIGMGLNLYHGQV